MDLLFLQTGGTIDKDYPRTRGGYAFEISDPAVERILERVNPSLAYRIDSIAKKDSLELTGDDRRAVRQACQSSDATRIVVTHGTDTMVETAAALCGIEGKVIVVTGAMRPERFSNSDAAFNVGLAVGAALSLQPGVYIAMHGRVLPWDNVTRNAAGQFVAKSPSA